MKPNGSQLTATVNVYNNFLGFNEDMLSSFYLSLKVVDILYRIGTTGDKFSTSETYFFNKIIDILTEGGKNLDKNSSEHLLHQIQNLKLADYDMNSVSHLSSEGIKLELILGKIISPENQNKKMFGGVLGIHDTNIQSFVDSFDAYAGQIYESSELSGCNSDKSFSDIKSIFRCMNVAGLAGELNRKNKPVSVFYSGGGSKNIASLPNVILFSNLYLERFKIISSRLGTGLIKNYRLPEDEILIHILVCWLRGHDLGHVFGEDNLGKSMKDHRTEYYILHELKSDIVALALLKRVSQKLFGNNIIQDACTVFLSEMFRYIRKGDFIKFPDSGSAYFVFRYFIENSALSYDSADGKYEANYEIMNSSIEELLLQLFNIFEKGNKKDALAFINKYGNIKINGNGFLKSELPQLLSTDAPGDIDFNFNEP